MSVLFQLRKRVSISLSVALLLFFWAVGLGSAEMNNQPVLVKFVFLVTSATQGIVSGQVIRIKYDQLTHKYHNKPI